MPAPYRITLTYLHTAKRRRFHQTYHAAAPKHSPECADEVAQYITDLHDAIWIPFPKTALTCTIRRGSIVRRYDHLPSAATLLQTNI